MKINHLFRYLSQESLLRSIEKHRLRKALSLSIISGHSSIAIFFNCAQKIKFIVNENVEKNERA